MCEIGMSFEENIFVIEGERRIIIEQAIVYLGNIRNILETLPQYIKWFINKKIFVT